MPQTARLAPHPLRRRFLAQLAGLGAASILLTLVSLKLVLVPAFERTEGEFAALHGERIRELLAYKVDAVAATAARWASWDATFALAAGTAPDFVRRNVTADVLSKLNLGMMAAYDAQGRQLFAVEQVGGELLDVEAGTAQVLQQLLTVAGSTTAQQGVAGLVGTDRGAALVALHPIVRSDSSGPAAGTLIVARPLDATVLANLARLARVPVTLLGPDEPALPAELGRAGETDRGAEIAVAPLGRDAVATYTLIRDLHGAPLLVVRADARRTIGEIGRQAMHGLTAGLVAVILMLLAVESFLVEQLVVSPIVGLTLAVLARRQAADFGRPLAARRQDEIGVLATEFDALRADLDSARRRLEQLLSASAVVVYSMSTDGRRFAFVSANVATVFGLVPERLAAEPQGWNACILGEDRMALDYARQRAAQGEPIEVQYRVRIGEAGPQWVLDKLRPVVGEDGQVAEIVGSWSDVTALKDAQETLRRWAELQARLAAEAEAASRAKSAFIAMMSHEIRTPLNGVVGAIDLLAERVPAGEGRTLVDAVRTSAAELQALLDHVVDLSRLIAGEVTLEPGPLQPQALVAEAVAACRAQAKAKGLPIGIEIAPDVPATVLGDRSRLMQMLRNYLDNAVKFTAMGRIRVQVSRAAGERLRFCVQDTGIGVPEERRAELFADFAELDPSSARRLGGLGIGLTITRRLAELMGGAVGVAEAPRGGSRFWFEVPLPAIASAPALPVLGPEITRLEVAGRAVAVLMVEDNRTNQLILRSMLERVGCEVEIAETGKAGIDAAIRSGYDIIMMDINLPDIDGVEATHRIRELGITTPILAVTASASELDRQHYLEAGMNGCLGKPLDRPTLQAALQEVLAALESRNGRLRATGKGSASAG